MVWIYPTGARPVTFTERGKFPRDSRISHSGFLEELNLAEYVSTMEA